MCSKSGWVFRYVVDILKVTSSRSDPLLAYYKSIQNSRYRLSPDGCTPRDGLGKMAKRGCCAGIQFTARRTSSGRHLFLPRAFRSESEMLEVRP